MHRSYKLSKTPSPHLWKISVFNDKLLAVLRRAPSFLESVATLVMPLSTRWKE
jgi:hypothetical protein